MRTLSRVLKYLQMLAGALVSIFLIHWKLASLMIIVLPALGLVVNRFGARIRQLAWTIQEKIADLTSTLQETLAGIRIVKAFGMEKHEEKRFAEFAYKPGQPVLRGIDLEVAPGKVIAIVGPSGAGKTTLVNLIPRFYDVGAGVVEIDGYDVRRVKNASLRKQIGLVPQETILFGASVAENIAYGRPEASRDEVIGAAKAANAHEFIMALPQGYDTVVGERETSLSGGQRQRIAIARAVLRDPRILILDEATSALDAEAEMLVQDALRRLIHGRTTFIVAHRLLSIKHADWIVVLEKGRIVEMGSHSQLLAGDGLYRRLYERQLETEGVYH